MNSNLSQSFAENPTRGGGGGVGGGERLKQTYYLSPFSLPNRTNNFQKVLRGIEPFGRAGSVSVLLKKRTRRDSMTGGVEGINNQSTNKQTVPGFLEGRSTLEGRGTRCRCA